MDDFGFQLGSFAGSSLQIGDVDAKSHYESYTVSCDPQACQRCTDNTWQERVNYVHGDILIGGEYIRNVIFKTLQRPD